ncbi:MAG TPA: GNAT family N-acetyltransferase [Solirubrobacterales bacterium]|nr:GNAT family N-acetyltransferase [Solirubrobacterales bacterium]
MASSFVEMGEQPYSEIRRAGAGDAANVARLLHDFNAEYDEPTPSVPALAERVGELLGDGAITVLLAGDPPLGFALFRLRPSLWAKAADAYLEELYVIPKQRRKGIGRALLNASIDAAREAGANHFELTTGETDTEARALYESRGFTNHEGAPDGPRMLYYELDL